MAFLRSCLSLLLLSVAARADSSFQYNLLDEVYYLYQRDVGDIDGDGHNDILGVQEGDTTVQVFRAPAWTRSTVFTFTGEYLYPRADDFKLADLNGDGKLDVVTRLGLDPADTGPGQAVWLENLGGGTNFTQHVIGESLEYVKDIVVADFDRDGRLDVVMRMSSQTQVWFQEAADTWTEVLLDHPSHEGMEAGDLNGDEIPDIILNGFWFETPNTPADARIVDNYVFHIVDDAWFDQFDEGDGAVNSCKVVVGDFDGDGTNDVAFSHSERPGFEVAWYRSENANGAGPWTKHPVTPVDYCHNLQAADFDLDGTVDLLVGGMVQSDQRGLRLMLNQGGGTSWTEFVIQTDGSYSAEVGDLDEDGDLDIVGILAFDQAPSWFYRNSASGAQSLDFWFYKQVTDQHERTFSLCFPDVNGDGKRDIASGPFVYVNPGGGMTDAWSQVTLPDSVHAFATLDVDGDNLADLIGQRDNPGADRIDLYWVEASNASGTTWTPSILIGDVPRGSEPEGFQGYAVAQINAGGRPEILVNSPEGLYHFTVPTSDPEAGNWLRTLIAQNNSEEGIGVADLDGDGDLDLSFTHGNPHEVKWARNPGDGSGDWDVFVIGSFPEADWPDRCAAADLNADGRVDIIVTEENSGSDPDALACWWEQPANDPTAANWVRHVITDAQYTMNSMDVGDVDQDGDMDIVLAEHRGTQLIGVWANDGSGNFTEHRVDEGKESHLGGCLVDLEGDGDLDLVSISYDASNELHVWRNDSAQSNTDTTPPTLTRVASVNATTVQVLFSEPVTTTSAQTSGNYSINNGVSISAAVLEADTRTVTLTTSALGGGNYTLTVNNVADRATPPNSMAPNSEATFEFVPVSPPADITFGSASSTVETDDNNSASLTFAQSALTNGYIVVGVSMWDPAQNVSITTANYDGTPMTFLGTASSVTAYAEVYLFGLAVGNKAAGNYLVALTASANVRQIAFGVSCFSGVHQTASCGPFASAIGTFSFASPSTTSASVQVSSAAADLVVDILGYDDGQSVLGASQAQNWRIEDTTDLADGVSSREVATSATTTMSHALNFEGVEWAIGSVALKRAGPPPSDTTAPTITSATAINATTVQVVFSEPVTTASAQTAGNYSINNGVTISGALLGADTRTVTLTTSTLGGGNYTVAVNNVSDRATPANAIAPNSQASFSFTPSDTTPPTLTSVTAVNATTVQVLFSEPVTTASAQTSGNYSINNGVSVSGAVLGADTRTVTLTTSTLGGGNYTVTVNNVADRATPANPIAANSQAVFSFTPSLGSPQFNGAGSAVDLDGNNSASLVFAQGALTEGYIVVGVSMYDPVVSASITSVTYDGAPMTLLGTVQDANAYSEVYLFGLAVGDKAAGNYAVALTGSTGIDQLVFGVSAFAGVSQTASTGGFASATGASLAASVNVSSAAGDLVVDLISQDDGISTLGAGQTQNWRQEDGTDRADGVSSRKTAAGGTTTMSYAESEASSWSLGAVALKSGSSPDTTPPTLASVTAVNATTVQVLFSEPVTTASAQTSGNYAINNGVSITGAVLGADTRTVTLTTSTLGGGNYTLTVNNVTDRATPANPIAANSQASFSFTPSDTTPPTLTSVTAVNATTVQVLFSEPVTTASAQTAGNYAINNGVSITGAVLGADTRTVTLTTSTLGGGNYTVTVNNVADRATPANPIAANSQAVFSFTPSDTTPPTITSVTAVNATTVQVLFSEPVTTASAQTAGNYSINNGVSISGAVLGADTRTVTLTTSTLGGGNYMVTVNNVADRATPANPIAANSQAVFSFTPSLGSPQFNGAGSAVDLDGNNSASLVFAQGALTEGYIVVGVSMYDPVASASITSVTYDGAPMTLLGTVQDANAYSEVYLFGLAVGNKAAGNYAVALTGSTGIDQLVFGVSAFAGVSQTASTGGFASATGASLAASVNVSSAAGDLVVDLISQDNGISTPGAGQTQNWRQEDGTDRADGVSSRKTAAGGTTTMSYAESEASSWSLGAVALKSGSSPDTTPPTLASVTAVNATTVQVLFSEPVTTASAQTSGNYAINNGVSITGAVLGADTRTVTLTTSTLGGGNYTLTVNNVTDRATPANPIAANSQASFSFTPSDTTPPTLTSVTAANATTVQVLFSEAVTTASAQTAGNYSINNGVSISGAVLGADTRTVTLTTSTLGGGNYTAAVNNVTDRATPANTIAANSQAAFSFASSPTTPVFNAAASAADTDGNNSASLVFGQGALASGYIVVGVSMYDPVVGAGIATVTYDGTPMPLLGTAQDANAYTEVYLFGLAVGNKAAGNYTLSLTASTGIDQLVLGVSSYSGVHQTASTGPFALATGWDTAPLVNVSSAAGDLVVDVLGQDSGVSVLGANQTQNWKQEDGTDRTDGASARESATGNTTTMSHSKTVFAPWSLGAVALKGGASSPDTITATMVMSSPPLNRERSLVPHIEIIALGNDTVALSWRAIPGRTYRVQYKTNLHDAVWNDLPGDVTAGSDWATKTNVVGTTTEHRFYRVQMLSP